MYYWIKFIDYVKGLKICDEIGKIIFWNFLKIDIVIIFIVSWSEEPIYICIIVYMKKIRI